MRSRTAANITDAPKKITSAQATVFLFTGRDHTRAQPGFYPQPRVTDRPVLAGVLGALVIAFS